jgi:hypothetical protein
LPSIIILNSFPIYTKARADESICSFIEFATNLPSISPILTRAIRPLYGISRHISAVDALLTIKISASFLKSVE